MTFRRFFSFTLVLFLLATVSPIKAQDILLSPITSHDVEIDLDSGHLYNNGDSVELVWTDVVEVKDANWIRLSFSSLALGDDGLDGQGSVLKIISLEDGADQVLNTKTAKQWRNTSAYFNGDAVRLELYAAPNGKLNQVHVAAATAGDAAVFARSICGPTDDRQLSNDPRGARLLPLGCSGWLFNGHSNCFLTAGHCVTGNLQVAEFNVPLSDSNGSINVSDPDDQYPVDDSSRQGIGAGVGEDWGYFGCFNNSNTGLSPLEAQGDSYTLALPSAVNAGDQIRITGYGSTGGSVDPRWNQAQKTQVGPHATFDGNRLGYGTDTTGGNSGSPVVLENTGIAIGIHTHGGCTENGGENSGTGSNHPDFQNALANPTGICLSSVGINFPNGRPAALSPSGGTTLEVVAFDEGIAPVPGTGELHFDDGSGFQVIPMNVISDNVYEAVFPATTCGNAVRYYVSVDAANGQSFTSPAQAPAAVYSAFSAVALAVAFEDNFQGNMGWSVSGNAADGQWQRGIPTGGGDRGDPAADGDSSGSCYVTDNADDNSDVDDGSTVLTSPTMDATSNPEDSVILSYYRWYSNDFGASPMADTFVVEISNDNGATWTDLEIVGPTGPEVIGGWIFKTFDVRDFVTPTDQMRVRFTASDLGDGSVVEAGVDGVSIEVIDCGGAEVVPAANYTVFRGLLASGDVSDVASSDDSYLSHNPGFTLNSSEPPVWLIFDASLSSDSPAEFGVTIEANANTPGLTQTLEMFNWNIGQFESIDSQGASFNQDLVVTIDLSADAAEYVQPGTGTVMLRSGWAQTGFTLLFPWMISVDNVEWTASN